MVTKKQSKKHKESTNQDQPDRKKLFGVDLKTIGSAIATAVVAEIAQTALNKASHSQQNGDHGKTKDETNSILSKTEAVASSTGEALGDTVSATGNRLKGALSVAEEKLENWNPHWGEDAASKLAQEILEELKPALVGLTAAVIKSVEDAYRSATDGVKSGQDTATGMAETVTQVSQGSPHAFQSASGDLLRSVQNGVAGITETAKTALEEIKPVGKDSKKKKKKKTKKH